jgi:DNA (cytosine-5)-methyltransferase 1
MKVLDLFSGRGGFSEGLEQAGGFETVAFCENDENARTKLRETWPDVPIYEDIRSLTGGQIGSVDVICGGFPCQDISRAGKGAGLFGKRSGLWAEMLRLISELRPSYAIIENVSRLRSNGLVTVLQNLYEVGYDAEWHCIPGYAVGSPQERDRVFIVAYPMQSGRSGRRPGWVGRWISGSEEARQNGWCGNAEADVQFWAEPPVARVADGLPQDVIDCRLMGNMVIPKKIEMIGRAILACS